jgi:circadian clock protein KaiC
VRNKRDALAGTGIRGLDTILAGGLPRNGPYVVQGKPGSGKTTLALQFAVAGARSGERVLYVVNGESEHEIHQVAASHGWSLDGVTVKYQDTTGSEEIPMQQSVLHPADVDVPATIEKLLEWVDELEPERLVIGNDGLTLGEPLRDLRGFLTDTCQPDESRSYDGRANHRS